MKLVTFFSAAIMVVATKARTAVDLNKSCDLKKPHARIINRCDYPVNIWSVFKGDGCPGSEMVTLKKGQVYKENLEDPMNGEVGVSIKISKTKECKGNDIVQLEYFLEKRKEKVGYHFNYLDVSYVDCLNNDCPTKKEGYYLKAGNQTGAYAASAGNTWCPILSCHDAKSCAKMSYILPDDVQTKTCDLDQSMDFYMCGGNAPTDDDEDSSYNTPAPSSPGSGSKPKPSSVSSKKAESLAPAPTSAKDAYTSAAYKVEYPAVTKAPEVKAPVAGQKTKTVVVYATAYEYVNAKHGHARRHQHFHA